MNSKAKTIPKKSKQDKKLKILILKQLATPIRVLFPKLVPLVPTHFSWTSNLIILNYYDNTYRLF